MSDPQEPMPPPEGHEQLRIVYITGTQNSGSTLLDTILGNAPGAYSLGEIAGFYRYAEESECDCGLPPATCAPCRAVLSAVADAGQLASFQRVAPMPLKERRAHWLLVGTRNRAEYARQADLVFVATATATGSTILIDSSKNVTRAAALVHDSAHDVRVVHLVRDGRGHLASRRRRAAATRRRYLPFVSMAAWLGKNLLISVLLRRRLAGDRYLLCRYEDLITDPAGELRRIGDFTGIDVSALGAAVTGQGLARRHLFEPPRRADYHTVRLDPGRLHSQRLSPVRNAAYWVLGGFVSTVWGYDRRQSYLDRAERARIA